MTSEEIGKVKYTVEADISGVKRDIGNAKKEVESFGDEAEASGKKAKSSLEGVSGAAESVASKLGKATGIVAAFGAAVGGVLKAYEAIAEYVKNGQTLAELFTADFDTVNSTEQALGRINTRIQEVGSELARKDEGGVGSLLGRSRKQIEEELEALRVRQLSISRQVRRQRQLELQQTQEDFLEQAKKLENQTLFSLLPKEEQIAESARMQKEALIKAADEARIEIENDNIKAALAAIDKKAQAEIEANRKVLQQREFAEKQAAERQAKAIATALERELAGISDALFGTGGLGFTTRLDTLVKELKEIQGDIRSLK